MRFGIERDSVFGGGFEYRGNQAGAFLVVFHAPADVEGQAFEALRSRFGGETAGIGGSVHASAATDSEGEGTGFCHERGGDGLDELHSVVAGVADGAEGTVREFREAVEGQPVHVGAEGWGGVDGRQNPIVCPTGTRHGSFR